MTNSVERNERACGALDGQGCSPGGGHGVAWLTAAPKPVWVRFGRGLAGVAMK